MDKIIISDLAIKCRLGCQVAERRRKQTIWVNLILHTDLTKAGQSDQLEDTVNYQAVCTGLSKLFASREHCLLERCAEIMAEYVLSNFAVTKVTVQVTKSSPIKNVAETAVEIERQR